MHPRVLLTLWLCVLPALAFGQDTRAGQIAAQQAEKARRLAPRKAPWAESVLLSVRKTLVETPSGFYPYLASVYSGGGFTLGAGLRQYTGDQTHVSIAGLYSAKSYKLVEVAASSPGHLSDHLDLHAIASWRDATQVAYHGLGIESPELDTGYRMQQMFVGGDLTARPLRFVRLMGAVSFEDYTLKDPTGT